MSVGVATTASKEIFCYASNFCPECQKWVDFVPARLGEAAAEFICHEKNMHLYINVKDRRAARKE